MWRVCGGCGCVWRVCGCVEGVWVCVGVWRVCECVESVWKVCVEGGGVGVVLLVFVLLFCRKEQRRPRQEGRFTLTLRRVSSWLR